MVPFRWSNLDKREPQLFVVSGPPTRLLNSCQLTAKHTVATPVNWKKGEDVIIPPSVSDEQAKQKYPQGWKTLKPYLRIVGQPRD